MVNAAIADLNRHFNMGAPASTTKTISSASGTSERLPVRAIDLLQLFFPGLPLSEVSIRAPLPGDCAGRRACMLQSVGTALDIYIDPEFNNSNGAEFLALIGHETQHLIDRRDTPGFARRFREELDEAKRKGLTRRDISFENRARDIQIRILCSLLDAGVPK